MANIPIRDIPGAVVADPNPSNLIPMDNGTLMQKTTISNAAQMAIPLASQGEAEAGVNNFNRMSALRVKQSIASEVGVSIASAANGALAATAVQPDRTITAGTGLTGGGSLAANRTIALSGTSIASLALADTSVQPARTITAGTGLTGGGNLSANRTIALDANSIASLSLADTAIQPSSNRLLPSGGTTGQVLAKTSGTNYAVGWSNAGSGDMTKAVYDPNSVNYDAFSRNSQIRLKWFGAAGNDSADDNTPFANFIAAAAGATYEYDAIMDAGTYRINAAHQLLNPDGRLYGQGRATVKYVGGAVTGVLKVSDASQPRYRQTLRDFTIQGNANSQILLQIDRVNQIIVDNINLRDAHPGNAAMQTISCVSGEFRNIKCSFAGHPFTISTPLNGLTCGTGTTSSTQTIDCTFTNLIVEGVGGNGIGLINAWDNTFVGGTSEGNTGWGVRILDYCERNLFINMFFEHNTAGDIWIEGHQNIFLQCEFTSDGAAFGNNSSIFVNGGDYNKFIGGRIKKISIDGGAVGTVLDGVSVDEISDAGTSTIIRNCRKWDGTKIPDKGPMAAQWGTTAERPTPLSTEYGRLYFNRTDNRLQAWNGSSWLTCTMT